MKQGDVVAVKYRLTTRLGRGGMAEVWRAEHLSSGRNFAIKLMHAFSADNDDVRERFLREARASSRIRHPGIVDVIDVGELDDGIPYLVMELLDGLPLSEVLDCENALCVRDLVSIIADVARAVGAAHAEGVVHRDLKPANIFLHRERGTGLHRAKVVDFGVSKIAAAGDGIQTLTNEVLGSPRYMSPEQARSAARTDARTDLWALGVILFSSLAGDWPHDGGNYTNLVLAITSRAPKSIDELAPHLPPALRAVVTRCLLPRDERIESALELANALERVLREHDLSRVPLRRPPRAVELSPRKLPIRLFLATPKAEGTQPDDYDTTTRVRATAKRADVSWPPLESGSNRARGRVPGSQDAERRQDPVGALDFDDSQDEIPTQRNGSSDDLATEVAAEPQTVTVEMRPRATGPASRPGPAGPTSSSGPASLGGPASGGGPAGVSSTRHPPPPLAAPDAPPAAEPWRMWGLWLAAATIGFIVAAAVLTIASRLR
jgi:serine/threonine protein kinase